MEVIRYNLNEQGNTTALCAKTGHKYTYLLPVGFPLRVVKVPNTEQQYFKQVLYKGEPYPVKRAVKHLRRMAKGHDVSKQVKEFLK